LGKSIAGGATKRRHARDAAQEKPREETMLYELQTLTVRPATVPAVLTRMAEAFTRRAPAVLTGCWYTELGTLNQIVTIWAHRDVGELTQARQRALKYDELAPIADLIVAMGADAFMPFPFMQEMKPGKHGPFYELRDYILKPDGLAPTIEIWARAIDARTKLSAVSCVMHSLTGASPRFVHLWPYSSLDERHRLRAQAVQMGVWPPPGGPDRLVAQRASILLPAPFSPMQ
jgi:hypothetical protein